MDMTINNPCWGKLKAPWIKDEATEAVPLAASA